MAGAGGTPSGQSKPLSESLSDLQARVERLLGNVDGEELTEQVADIVHEIAALRLLVDLPAEGDRRRDLREPRRDISIFRIDEHEVDCAIQDLSIGGAYIVADLPVAPDTIIELNIPEAGNVAARVVRKTDDGVHVQFEDMTDPQVVAITNRLQAHYMK